jgi:GH18 family chitinase
MKTNIHLSNKRYISLIISFLFAVLLFSDVLSAQTKVVGYFTHYRRDIYPADSIEIGNLTHINHAFAWANADGSIYTPNGFLYPALNAKVHNAGKKILLCFGSDGISTFANFGNVLANSTLRATFVSNITNFLIANNYDGADFDWESPTCSTDRANYLSFISALRASFNAANSKLLITMAVTVDDYCGQWSNYESMTQYIDWYNMMGYDIHGSWISHTGYNAPLYTGSDTHGCSSVDGGVKYLNGTRSIPLNKIVLGVPFYGYEYTGTTGYLSSYSSVTQLSYSQVLAEVKTGGFVYHWDSGASVPYYMNTSTGKFISFDDTTSLHIKVNYSAAQGLGGVMIWELDNDMVSGHQPLLELLGKTLLGNSSPVVNLPAQVILLNPVNLSLNQPVQLNLTWHKAAYASNYTVQVATDVNFTNIIVNSSSITDTTKSISFLANNTKYYWRVQGTNQYGSGTQSSTNSFTTVAAITIPGQPTPLSPLNNALNQAISLQLKWTKVSGATSYIVQLSRSTTFNSLDLADSSLTDTVRQISSLLNNTIYYWRVKAKNSAGMGTGSNSFSFTTIAAITIPGKPTLLTPLNNAVNQAISLQLKWTKVSGTTSYLVQLSKSNTFSSLVIGDSSLTDTVRQISSLLNNTNYYWRVRAKNSAGIGAWSNTFLFTTISLIPGTPVLIYPSNGLSNIPLQITFKWNKAVNADRYCLQIATDNLFANLIVSDHTITDTTITETLKNQNAKYYWKVTAVNTLGFGDWPTAWSFTTGNSKNYHTTASTATLNEITLSWQNSDAATTNNNELISYTYELMQNYPNPFNPATVISYQLAAVSKVQIKVFDALGREIKTLVNDEKPAGKYQIVWNATDNYGKKVTSGIYIYSLKTNGYSQTRKMILMK